MKDLDFDELDKAVNSLIASTPGGAGSDNAMPLSSQQPLSVNSAPTQTVTNSLPTIPMAATFSSVDRPSTGRFMDVVHPSSDMRTSLVMPERGQPLKTASPITKPILSTTEPTVNLTRDNEVINIAADKDEDDDDINQLGNDIAKSLGQVSNDSPDSPFLSDAKVEKRPLGAFSNDLVTVPANQPMIPEVAQPPMVQPVVSNVPEPHSLITPLPAELQSDLLSLESESTTQPEKPIANNFPVIEKPQPNLPVLTSPTPTPVPVSNPMTTTTTTTTTVPASTSIPQQYKEQPNTGDQNSGAIYDTKAYHKPMVKPTKKKSGWMWVFWIVILLVTGGGAGAAVYFFI